MKGPDTAVYSFAGAEVKTQNLPLFKNKSFVPPMSYGDARTHAQVRGDRSSHLRHRRLERIKTQVDLRRCVTLYIFKIKNRIQFEYGKTKIIHGYQYEDVRSS